MDRSLPRDSLSVTNVASAGCAGAMMDRSPNVASAGCAGATPLSEHRASKNISQIVRLHRVELRVVLPRTQAAIRDEWKSRRASGTATRPRADGAH
jgi:hypothetical protein